MRGAIPGLLALVAAVLLPRLCLAVATDLSLQPERTHTFDVQVGDVIRGDDSDSDADYGYDYERALMEDFGAENVEKRENSDGSLTLNFHMPDDEWDKRQQDICSMPGVTNCGVNHCREFLAADNVFTGQVNNIQGGPVAGATIALLPSPPDVAEFIDEGGQAADTQADQEDDDEDKALNLAMRPGKRRCPNQRSGAGPVIGTADGAGKFSLDAPADFDPGCWELKAAQSCEVQDLPTRSVMPEREPMHLLALLPGASKSASQDQKDAANAAGMAAGLTVVELVPLVSIDKTLVRFRVNSGGNGGTDTAMLALQASQLFQGAQPEQRFRTSAGGDPYAWMNYGAEQTGAQRLHPVTDGSGVTVAVIDTGVDAAHPELASRLAENIDVSGFGMSPDRHGTAIAGIIAAESGNGIGSYGVAPGTRILAIKACEPETAAAVASRCWSSTLAKALDHALQSDAAIINMSLGGPEDALISMLLDKAAESGVLVLAAAGNDGPNAPPPFPASHPTVMAVTAVDSDDRLYSGAVRGEFVEVAAPGVEIAVPTPGEIYPAQLTGTSMATAHVAGAAALLFSAAPEATANAVRQSLQTSAVGSSDSTGHGRIDVCGAAKTLSNGASACVED